VKTLQEHLAADGTPKRILSLDGGGIRGIITLQYLKRIETLLRERYNNDNMVLSDYFDFIGGTSTGSIIASALALGRDVDYIIGKYQELARRVFPEWGILKFVNVLRFGVLYDKKKLEKELEDVFGEELLGSSNIKTGLGIVSKRADKNSIWMFYNHPDQHYYSHNKDIPLKNAIRASSAAPIVFPPQELEVKGADDKAWFEDGGVSMHNNPALLLFFTTTLKGNTDKYKTKEGEEKNRKGYGFNWETGADKLMLVSIGTGFWRSERSVSMLKSFNPLTKLKILLGILMDDSSQLSELLLQIMSQKSPTAREIDRMYGTASNENLIDRPKLHYLRYNLEIEQKSIKKNHNEYYFPNEIDSLRDMTVAWNIGILGKLSKKAADNVKSQHFPPEFDI
jgi:uncharacterized protein